MKKRKAQNHKMRLMLVHDGVTVGTADITFSDSVHEDGTAGPLYVQNGEAAGVIEELTKYAEAEINR